MRVSHLLVFALLFCVACSAGGPGPSDLPPSGIHAVLPSLAELGKVGSATGQSLTGSEYAAQLPFSRVTTVGSDCLLSGAGESFPDCAYAIYAFTLTEFSGAADIDFTFADAPLDCWIAWSDYSKSRWQFAAAAAAQQFSISAGDSELLFAADDRFYVAVIVAAEREERLSSITIGEPASDNQAPVASISVDTLGGIAPLTVAYDCAGSFDADGSILQYELDLNGDGIYEVSQETAPVGAEVYSQEGSYELKLRVTDDSGASDVAMIVIKVGGGLVWVANETEYPFPDYAASEIIFDAAGAPLVLHGDDEGDLCWSRAADEQGENWPGAAAAIDEDGQLFNVKVAMIGGRPAAAYTMDLEPSGLTDFVHRFVIAENVEGTAWSQPIPLPEAGSADGVISLMEIDGLPAVLFDAFVSEESASHGFYTRALDSSGSAWGAPVQASDPDTVGEQFGELFLLEGKPAWVVVVHQGGGDYYLRLCRANDALGESWAASTEVALVEIGISTNPCAVVLDGLLSVFYADYSNLSYVRATDSAATTFGSPVQLLPCAIVSGITIHDCFGRPALAWVDFSPVAGSKVEFMRADDLAGTMWPADSLEVTFTSDTFLGAHGVASFGSLDGYPAALTGGWSDPLKISRLL